jgi:hypothetical protein
MYQALERIDMTYTDQGYEPICEKAKIQNHTFTFDEAARLQRIVWEASGTPAFSSPNGNMIRALVNLVAQEVKLKEKNHG